MLELHSQNLKYKFLDDMYQRRLKEWVRLETWLPHRPICLNKKTTNTVDKPLCYLRPQCVCGLWMNKFYQCPTQAFLQPILGDNNGSFQWFKLEAEAYQTATSYICPCRHSSQSTTLPTWESRTGSLQEPVVRLLGIVDLLVCWFSIPVPQLHYTANTTSAICKHLPRTQWC